MLKLSILRSFSNFNWCIYDWRGTFVLYIEHFQNGSSAQKV